jgi:hypothetical protein
MARRLCGIRACDLLNPVLLSCGGQEEACRQDFDAVGDDEYVDDDVAGNIDAGADQVVRKSDPSAGCASSVWASNPDAFHKRWLAKQQPMFVWCYRNTPQRKAVELAETKQKVEELELSLRRADAKVKKQTGALKNRTMLVGKLKKKFEQHLDSDDEGQNDDDDHNAAAVHAAIVDAVGLLAANDGAGMDIYGDDDDETTTTTTATMLWVMM